MRAEGTLSMPLHFCPLFSGSSGNAIFVGAGDTRVLIDAGLPGKRVSDALHEIDVLPETLGGIVVTHEHSDHIAGVGVLARKYHLPVYANERTWSAMAGKIGEIAPWQRRMFDNENVFYIGDIAFHPFSVPHDAADPVGYRAYYGGHSVAVATDMGYMKKSVMNALAGAEIVLLESNHDPDMLLRNPRYSVALKKRILGNHGHLSNDTCARALLGLLETGVHRVVLGHLSGENNTPELALNTSLDYLISQGVSPQDDLNVDLSWRDRVGGLYTVA